MSKTVPQGCPACGATLDVVKLECPVCQTEVAGRYALCPVCRLGPQNRRLFDLYLKARGNVRDVQRMLGVSYPTARQRIEGMFQEMGHGPTPPQPAAILERLRRGEIDVDGAERLLRGEMAASSSDDSEE